MISAKNLRPLGGMVLLERLSGDATTKGGIVIPESARSSVLARVVATGPGHYLGAASSRRRESLLAKGQTVLIPEWESRALFRFTEEGRELGLVDEDDVSAILEEG